MRYTWLIVVSLLLSLSDLMSQTIDKEYAKFVTTTSGAVAVRGSYAPLGTGTLPHGLPEREYGKFVTDTNGDVAVRVVLSDLPPTAVPTWGAIVGTLTNQTDLWAVLFGESNRLNGAAFLTADNQFTGTTNVFKTLDPYANDAYDLGSTNKQWRHLWLTGHSIYMDTTNVLSFSNGVLIVRVPMQAQIGTNQAVAVVKVGDNISLLVNDTLTLQTITDKGNITSNAIVIGTSTATGLYSFAQGDTADASGDYASAQGSATVASGRAAHAEGDQTVASGEVAHAEGIGSMAVGYASHVEGDSTIASNVNSHAEGQQTISAGPSSHAEGTYSQALADSSHAEGSDTHALSLADHSEGANTVASGGASHAEGGATTAAGVYSHAEGWGSKVYGVASHAAGLGGIATNDYTWVWSSHSPYTDHGAGTFNIGVGGTAGIWANDYQIYSNGILYSHDDQVATRPELASTTLGNEGMRMVGTVGGYALDELLEDTYPRGPSRDVPAFTYQMSPAVNLNVSWIGGDVYSPTDGYFHLAAGSNTLSDNAVNYAYWTVANPNQVLWTTGTRADVSNSIHLGTFVAAFGRLVHVGDTVPVGDMPLKMDEAHYNVMPSLIVSGLNYAPIGTNFNAIIQVGGTEFHDLLEKNVHPAKNLTNYSLITGSFLLTYAHTNVGIWGLTITNQLPVDQWDDGTNLIACTVSNWYRGVFLSAACSPSMHWVYPQGEYTNYADALAADDPALPSGFDPYVPKCTAYIFQGGDTELRQSGDSWVDRRFMIRRGTIAGSSSGSSVTPALYQVLLQSADTGGILPFGAGEPSQDGQLSNKKYVDSTINKVNGGKAYVDAVNGDDGIALIESSILPFKTITAAIDACGAVASAAKRFLIVVSPGNYNENVIMTNFVGIAAADIESTIINGSVTYPVSFTDLVGAELQQLTISRTNGPVLVLNMGDDGAYAGVRSCYLRATYDNDDTNKSLVYINRGLCELYGTTYNELNIIPTNGSAGSRNVQIYEATDDPANLGLSQLLSYSSSCIIDCQDENDDVSILFSHDNISGETLNTIQGGVARMYFDTLGLNYSNRVMLVHSKTATSMARCKDKIVFAILADTNACTVMFGYIADSVNGGSTAVLKDNEFNILGSAATGSNMYWGAATTVKDTLKVFNSSFINALTVPTMYTNNGSLGTYAIDTTVGNGDHYLGGALEMSTVNSAAPSTPAAGHVKIYADTVAGLESPYFTDSTGFKGRITRDTLYTGYNDETNTLQPGEFVYISAGISGTAQRVKRASATSMSTLPAMGIVVHVGGIAAGAKGRIMELGRTEIPTDTSMWTSGDKLYISETVPGGVTNVAPSGTNFSQLVGWCNVSATNGYIKPRCFYPDVLGGLLPSAWVKHTEADEYLNWTRDNTNNLWASTNKVWDIAGNTNTYQSGYSKAFDIAGNTNSYQLSYTWLINNTNNIMLSTNKVWDIAGNTNNYQAAYNWLVLNTNNVTLSTNKVWDIAGNTNNYQAGYSWVNSNSGRLATASTVFTNPITGISIGASANSTLAFTNRVSLAASSNYVIHANGLVAFTGSAGNARGVDAYVYVSYDTGFAVSNMIGRMSIVGIQITPQTNMLNGFHYARNMTNALIKVEYKLTSTSNGAGTYTNFNILIEPK